jgi:nicotinate-nucleotide adenylyltransferase
MKDGAKNLNTFAIAAASTLFLYLPSQAKALNNWSIKFMSGYPLLADRGTVGHTKRAGLLGGAFDPPHEGHLRLAQLAWDYLKLDELRFVPAFIAPQKQKPIAPTNVRLAMLREMLSPTPFIIDDIELEMERVSYTVDTLETLSKREPGTTWILAMGSDQAANFATWRGYERIMELASVSFALRPDLPETINNEGIQSIPKVCTGTAKVLPQDILSARLSDCWSGAPGQLVILPSTDLNLASSQIRGQLACGKEPFGLSEKVKSVIMREKLYC